MSETVLLSKAATTAAAAAAARQRPKSNESIMSSVAGAADSLTSGTNQQGSCCVGETKASDGANVAPGSPVVVKDLVRDNRRLVKDLMALLAIREATKDTIGVGSTDAPEGEPATVRCGGVPLKNRPGANDGGDSRVIALRAVGGGPGTRATAVAAAVASLLHHTATKEFSSLAGEMIAIAAADDDDDNDSNGRKLERVAGVGTNADDGGPMLPAVMLHADAAASDANTNTNTSTTTDEAACSENVSEPAEPTVEGRRHGGESGECDTTGEDVMAKPVEEGFLSGPVPARTPRAGTPLPLPDAIPAQFAPQPCYECCMPSGAATAELTLEQKLDKLLDSVVKIKADMHRRIDRLGRRVEQIHLDVQLNIDSTDRALLRNDLLLIGIPYREREDLQQRFRCVCRALEYAEQDIPQVDIRRQRPVVTRRRNIQADAQANPSGDRQNAKAAGPHDRPDQPQAPAPIVVEFMFKTLRDQFYRAYQAKRVLRLSDIGFASDRRCFVNEVLTRYNQKLMGEAVRRKRAGQLHSVYTVDGVVYVQRSAGEKGTKVTSFASMN